MTQLDKLKDLITNNPDAFAKWLDDHGAFDGSPWMEWFNNTYCNQCDGIECTYSDYWNVETDVKRTITCSYCELEDKCRFFPEHEGTLDNIDIIKLWLNTETN